MTVADTISALFPLFGNSKVLDVPLFDPGKHMYLVEQYLSKKGNRYLSYVGISNQLLVEVTLGHFHSWEYVDKVRALICDGNGFRVVCSWECTEPTHFSHDLLVDNLMAMLTDYVVMNSLHSELSPEQVSSEVKKIVSELFLNTPSDLKKPGMRQMLVNYCDQRMVCRDFVELN